MKEKRVVLLMLFLLILVNYLDRVNISTVGPTMMKELAIEPHVFGLILGAFTVGYACMQIPGGYLADRFGAKALLVVTPVLWSICTFATGLTSSIVALIAVRVLFGLCEGASNSSIYRMLGDVFDAKERSRVTGIIGLGFALGPATAAPLILWILTHSSWHFVFFWSALPGIVLAIAMYFVLPDRHVVSDSTSPSDHGPARPSGWKSFLRERSTWLLFAAYFLFNIGYWGYIGWMPSYLVMERHVNIKTLGYAASIPYVCGACGLLLIGWLGSGPMLRTRGLLAAACVCGAALSLFLTFQAVSIEATVAGLSAAAFFLYGVLGPYGSIVLDLAPARLRGSFSGVINTGGQIGGALAPVIVGYLVKGSGNFSTGFVFMECALIASAICYASLTPVLRRTLKPTLEPSIA